MHHKCVILFISSPIHQVRPYAELKPGSLAYNFDTTHMHFEWQPVIGDPDKLELQYT